MGQKIEDSRRKNNRVEERGKIPRNTHRQETNMKDVLGRISKLYLKKDKRIYEAPVRTIITSEVYEDKSRTTTLTNWEG